MNANPKLRWMAGCDRTVARPAHNPYLLLHALVLIGMLWAGSAVGISVTSFNASVWPRPDAALGVTGHLIEDFEDEYLLPGLLVELSDSADHFTATNRLPLAFYPSTHDPNGAQAFADCAWDGERALINRRTPVPAGYLDDGNWGDITFHFPGGASSLGFSLQQNDLAASLRINGSLFASLTNYLSTGTGRNGYVRIDAAPGEIIYSVTIANEGGDGITFDHLVFRPAQCPAVLSPPVPPGLVAWYRGETNAQDSAGTRHGTLQNGAGFSSGVVGAAFDLDGSNDYVDLGNWFDLQVFTLALWVYPRPTQQTYANIVDNNHTDFRSWVMQYDNTGLQFRFGAAGIGSVPFQLKPNTWQHLVAMVDSNRQMRVFLDGQIIGTAQGSSLIPYDGSQSLRLSAWGGGGRHFNGAMDEFQIFNRSLSSSEVVALRAVTGGIVCRECAPLPSSALAWWRGELGAMDGVSTNHGALQGGVSFVVGKVGQAFSFNGSSHVDIPDSPAWAFGTNDFSMALWANFSTSGGRQTFLASDNGPGSLDKWIFWLDNGQIIFHINGSPGVVDIGRLPFVPTVGQWYHLAVSRSGSIYSFFVNGVLATADTDSRAIPDATVPLTIGRAEGDFYFAGLLDEVALFNRSLSASEIAAMAAAGVAGFCQDQVFHPGFEFSLTNGNPNGVWSYGWSPPDFSAFHLCTNQHSSGGTMTWWGFDPTYLTPQLVRLTNDPTGLVDLHPGPNNEAALLRWIAPTAGVARVEGQFLPGDNGVMQVAVRRNNQPWWNAVDTGTFFLNTAVSAGDTVDFAVYGGFVFGKTPLNAQVFFTHAQVTNHRPDLVAANVIAPSSALMAQPVQLVFTLRNLGLGNTSGSWQNRVLTATNSLGQGAFDVGSFNFSGTLASGTDVVVTQSVILPAGVTGLRWLGLRLDSNLTIPESDESNNTSYSAAPINIMAADLVALDLGGPVNAQFGESLNVSWTVQNLGNAASSASWNDEVFLGSSSNSLADATLLATITGNALAVGAAYSRTQTVAFPLTATSVAGNYFIIVAADATDAQPESTETNNLIAVPVSLAMPPQSDLLPQFLAAPVTAIPALTAELVWGVTNLGMATAGPVWSEMIAISNASSVLPLAEFEFTNTLASGEGLIRTQTVTLPPTLAAGEAHFLVTVDSRFRWVESNEVNNTAQATNVTMVPAELTLILSANQLSEGAPGATATVTRNGDRSMPLLVTISNSAPDEIAVTNQVLMPAGQVSAAFPFRALEDGVVDGAQLVALTVSATNYNGDAMGVTVLDMNVPPLTLTLAASHVTEGFTFAATVARDYATNRPLTVVFSSSDPTQLLPPVSITIPSNQLAATFSVLAVDDALVESWRTNTFTAMAGGFAAATAAIAIQDNDLPTVTVNITAESISEGAGPQAANGTVTRAPVSARALVVDLISTNPAAALVPATVTIPAHQSSASFGIAAVDDALVDGPQTTLVRALIHASDSPNIIGEGAPDLLTVLDNDGPSLRLLIAQDLVAEGRSPATTANLTRNTPPTNSLTVAVVSSDPTEATTSVNVIIPDGETSVTFPISTPLDGVTDGHQFVRVHASAAGFTSAEDTLVVSDIDLPDLLVSAVATPTNGLSGANFSVSYRVENLGLAAAGPRWATRVFLSADPLPGNDTLLGQHDFNGTMAVGQFFDQTMQLSLPQQAGRYWIVVTADAASEVVEGLEGNNSGVSALPVEVSAAYAASAQTPVGTGLAGTSVPITGSATRTDDGQPATNVPVNVHIVVRDSRRVLSTMTDTSGNFSLNFTPLPGEAGSYQLGGAHPGVQAAPVQDTFTLLGMKIAPPVVALKAIEQNVGTGSLQIQNLSETPLTALTVTVVSNSPNLNVTANVTPQTDLPGNGTRNLDFAIMAADVSIPFGEVRLRVTSAEGATTEATVLVTVESLTARLSATPGSLYSAMTRGAQASVEFQLANLGGANSGPITVSPPNVPWLRVASANPLPSLAPGQSNRVTLLLTPAADLALGSYTGGIALNSAGGGLVLPFQFVALSEGKGDLRVSVWMNSPTMRLEGPR